MSTPSVLQITAGGGVLLSVPRDWDECGARAKTQLREGKRVLTALNWAVGSAVFCRLVIFNFDEDE